MSAVRTVLVVVTCRSPESALQSVDAVLPQLRSAGGGRVCVVAQVFAEGSLDALRRRLPDASHDSHHREVSLIEAGADAGLARSVNLALASLGDGEPTDCIWILSGGTTPGPEALSSLLVEFARSPAVGIVGMRAQGEHASLGHGPRGPLEVGDASLVSGNNMLILRRVVEDVGPFDEAMSSPFHVMDFCARARRVGWRVRAVVSHSPRDGVAETTEDARTSTVSEEWVESRRRYLRKHHGVLAASRSDFVSLAEAAVHTTKAMLGRDAGAARNELKRAARQVFAGLTDLSALSPDDVVSDQPATTEESDFMQLVREDFDTHARDLTEAGFWALLAHRLGSHGTRVPLGQLLGARLGQRVLSTAVDWVWGIQIAETARVGRRVRIWHSGCIVLDAREIGDDVQVRHNTTIGPERGHHVPRGLLPVIGDRAELGAGACVLGTVRVGEDATVGANSVVLKDVPSGSRVLGVPARPIPI